MDALHEQLEHSDQELHTHTHTRTHTHAHTHTSTHARAYREHRYSDVGTDGQVPGSRYDARSAEPQNLTADTTDQAVTPELSFFARCDSVVRAPSCFWFESVF